MNEHGLVQWPENFSGIFRQPSAVFHPRLRVPIAARQLVEGHAKLVDEQASCVLCQKDRSHEWIRVIADTIFVHVTFLSVFGLDQPCILSIPRGYPRIK